MTGKGFRASFNHLITTDIQVDFLLYFSRHVRLFQNEYYSP